MKSDSFKGSVKRASFFLSFQLLTFASLLGMFPFSAYIAAQAGSLHGRKHLLLLLSCSFGIVALAGVLFGSPMLLTTSLLAAVSYFSIFVALACILGLNSKYWQSNSRLQLVFSVGIFAFVACLLGQFLLLPRIENLEAFWNEAISRQPQEAQNVLLGHFQSLKLSQEYEHIVNFVAAKTSVRLVYLSIGPFSFMSGFLSVLFFANWHAMKLSLYRAGLFSAVLNWLNSNLDVKDGKGTEHNALFAQAVGSLGSHVPVPKNLTIEIAKSSKVSTQPSDSEATSIKSLFSSFETFLRLFVTGAEAFQELYVGGRRFLVSRHATERKESIVALFGFLPASVLFFAAIILFAKFKGVEELGSWISSYLKNSDDLLTTNNQLLLGVALAVVVLCLCYEAARGMICCWAHTTRIGKALCALLFLICIPFVLENSIATAAFFVCLSVYQRLQVRKHNQTRANNLPFLF